MSAKTWLKEFYPVKATKVSRKKALEHSIQKWRGLLKSNLRKHRLGSNTGGDVVDPNNDMVLEIDGHSCALCHHHFSTDGCGDCPLAEALSKSCYDDSVDDRSPFSTWIKIKNPKPMLRALRRARKFDGWCGTKK